MVYYVKYWITVRQENPDVKSFVVCGNLLSAPYLVKINTVRGGADRSSLRFEGLGWYNSKDCLEGETSNPAFFSLHILYCGVESIPRCCSVRESQ